MSARRAQLFYAISLALSLAPGVAHACAVCGGGNPANRFAFFASTIALSLLPLGMFTGGALWMRANLREQLAGEFTERDAVTPASPAPPVPAAPSAATSPTGTVPMAAAPSSR